MIDHYNAIGLRLQHLLRGCGDILAPALPGLLVVTFAMYGDAGMRDLIRRVWDARSLAKEAADRAFLNRLIDGTGELLSESTFPALEKMFAKYAEGSDMFMLLDAAVEAFSEAAQKIATWAMAGLAIDEARRDRDEQ